MLHDLPKTSVHSLHQLPAYQSSRARHAKALPAPHVAATHPQRYSASRQHRALRLSKHRVVHVQALHPNGTTNAGITGAHLQLRQLLMMSTCFILTFSMVVPAATDLQHLARAAELADSSAGDSDGSHYSVSLPSALLCMQHLFESSDAESYALLCRCLTTAPQLWLCFGRCYWLCTGRKLPQCTGIACDVICLNSWLKALTHTL